MNEQLTFLNIEQLAQKLDKGEIGSLELTSAYLDRIRRLDGVFHAYAEVCEELSLTQARASDKRRGRGRTLGPLDGIPIAVKDLCEIEGTHMSAGSKPWLQRRSTRTATAIARVAAAGAVILGKTHMAEFAFGAYGTNAWLGTPRNPWDRATHRVPGGSSSGSGVAVAAGLAAAAIGSDTGGSVRIPSLLNGITGLKTTAGVISQHACEALSPSFDTLGPMTRSAWDAALLTDSMAARDEADPRTYAAPRRGVSLLKRSAPGPSLAGTVIALLPIDQFPMTVAPAVARALDEAVRRLQGMGARIVEQHVPIDFEALNRIGGTIIAAEAWAQHGERAGDATLEIDPAIRQRILAAAVIPAAEYDAALAAHRRAAQAWGQWMAGFDAMLLPGTPHTACPVAEVDQTRAELSAFTRAANALRACALAFPAGFDEAGLPIGLQLYGKGFDEAAVLRIGRAFQTETDWHLRTPEN